MRYVRMTEILFVSAILIGLIAFFALNERLHAWLRKKAVSPDDANLLNRPS